MAMSAEEISDVTLAHVDPCLVSCWDNMVKRGEECSLVLKHSNGRVIATLQCTATTQTQPTTSVASSPSLSPSAKRKKNKKKKKQKLEKLLAYHQRLVVEKGLPPSRLMEEHAATSSDPSAKITGGKNFNCDQCDFASVSQRGLKVHVGRSHKDPEVLRAEEHEVSIALSELSEVREDDSSVKADTSFEAEQEAAEPAHPHRDWVVCPRTECKFKRWTLEDDIKQKRPCNKCGAKKQDDCDCHNSFCEDCNYGNECCNDCVCCDGRNEEITPSEWKAYFSSVGIDPPSGSSGGKKKISLQPKL